MNEVSVYIIAPVGAETPCKIGVSDQPYGRLETLRSGSPLPLEIVELYQEPDRVSAMALEREFHEAHADCRLHGEWFDISAEEANYWLFSRTMREVFDAA